MPANIGTPAAQVPPWVPILIRSIEREINRSRYLDEYTVDTVPDATANARLLIYVSDEVGGPTIAVSDGTDWRRAQDLAVIST